MIIPHLEHCLKIFLFASLVVTADRVNEVGGSHTDLIAGPSTKQMRNPCLLLPPPPPQ